MFISYQRRTNTSTPACTTLVHHCRTRKHHIQHHISRMQQSYVAKPSTTLQICSHLGPQHLAVSGVTRHATSMSIWVCINTTLLYPVIIDDLTDIIRQDKNTPPQLHAPHHTQSLPWRRRSVDHPFPNVIAQQLTTALCKWVPSRVLPCVNYPV